MIRNLATKYRPTEFEEVLSQDLVVAILKKQVELNAPRNCYLFHGLTGSGKTTLARIFANKLNKGIGFPKEIDAASHNGVDNIRDILLEARERSIAGTYKVFIIDECHALTSQAWQAFLKMLEEPPAFTIFILCTTELQKVPATILNRAMVMPFNQIPADSIKKRLSEVCVEVGASDYEESVDYISRICGGEMRKALSLLEKCLSYSTTLSIQITEQCVGGLSQRSLLDLVNYLIDGRENDILSFSQKISQQGYDVVSVVDQLECLYLDLTKYLTFKNISATKLSQDLEPQVIECTSINNASQYYLYVLRNLIELKSLLRYSRSPQLDLEVYLLKIARCLQ